MQNCYGRYARERFSELGQRKGTQNEGVPSDGCLTFTGLPPLLFRRGEQHLRTQTMTRGMC